MEIEKPNLLRFRTSFFFSFSFPDWMEDTQTQILAEHDNLQSGIYSVSHDLFHYSRPPSRIEFPIPMGWANLPDDVLRTILDMLLPFVEYTRPASVCKSWRRVALEHREHLLIASELYDRIPALAKFRCFDSELPFGNNERLCGCSHGCMVSVGPGNVITLYKLEPPIKSVSFPPIKYPVNKVILSHPIDADSYSLIASLGCLDKLAYFRSGDESWTYVSHGFGFIDDLLFLRVKLYVVNSRAAVFSVDVFRDVVDSAHPRSTTLMPPYDKLRIGGPICCYLTAASTGELLLVVRYYSKYSEVSKSRVDECLVNDPDRRDNQQRLVQRMTTKFRVFRVCRYLDGTVSWLEKSLLNHRTIFLGKHDSVVIEASEVPGCRPDCVYYTDDFIFTDLDRSGQCEIGFYCFRENRLRRHRVPRLSKKDIVNPVLTLLALCSFRSELRNLMMEKNNERRTRKRKIRC